jgi:predicted nucleic acid-binding Zn ribbon protein
MAPDWLNKLLGVRPQERKPEPKEEDYKVDVTPHGHCTVCGKPSSPSLQYCSKACADSKKRGGTPMIWWMILFMILMYFLFAR